MERRPSFLYRLLVAAAFTAALPAATTAQPVVDHVEIASGRPLPRMAPSHPGWPMPQPGPRP